MYIYTYIYIYICKYKYTLYILIYQYLMMIGRDGGFSTLFHGCGFSCQQRVLKTFLSLDISTPRIGWFDFGIS